jgi:hypothetical protein
MEREYRIFIVFPQIYTIPCPVCVSHMSWVNAGDMCVLALLIG